MSYFFCVKNVSKDFFVLRGRGGEGGYECPLMLQRRNPCATAFNWNGIGQQRMGVNASFDVQHARMQ